MLKSLRYSPISFVSRGLTNVFPVRNPHKARRIIRLVWYAQCHPCPGRCFQKQYLHGPFFHTVNKAQDKPPIPAPQIIFFFEAVEVSAIRTAPGPLYNILAFNEIR